MEKNLNDDLKKIVMKKNYIHESTPSKLKVILQNESKKISKTNNISEGNMNFEDIFLKYSQLQVEKQNVESSLRNEITHSEKLRGYCEILKANIQENLKESGLFQILAKSKDKNPIDNFIELEKRIKENNQILKSSQEKLKNLEKDKRDLQHTNKKLNEEKEMLLEFIDQHNKKENNEKIKNEKNKYLSENYTTLNLLLNETQNKLDSIKIKLMKSEENLQKKENENQENNKILEILYEGITDFFNKFNSFFGYNYEFKNKNEFYFEFSNLCDRIFENITDLKEQYKSEKIEKKKIKKEINEKNEHLSKIQKEYSDKNENLFKIKKELTEKNENLAKIKRELNEKNDNLTKIKKDLNEKNENLIKIKNDLNEKTESLYKIQEEIQKKNEELEKIKVNFECELNEKNEFVIKFKENYESQQNLSENLKKEVEEICSEKNNLIEENKKLQTKLANAYESIRKQPLKKRLDTIFYEINSMITDFKMFSDFYEEKEIFAETNPNCSYSESNLTELKNLISFCLQKANENIEFKKQIDSQQNEISNLENEIITISNEKAYLFNDLEQNKNNIKILDNHLKEFKKKRKNQKILEKTLEENDISLLKKKCLVCEKEKSILEYLIKQIKGIINVNLAQLLDQAYTTNIKISNLEIKKTDIQLTLETLDIEENTLQKQQQLKLQLKEIKQNLQILYIKKKQIDKKFNEFHKENNCVMSKDLIENFKKKRSYSERFKDTNSSKNILGESTNVFNNKNSEKRKLVEYKDCSDLRSSKNFEMSNNSETSRNNENFYV